ALRRLSGRAPPPLRRELRELLLVVGETPLPIRLRLPPPADGLPELLERLGRDEERLLPFPAEGFLRQDDFFLAERAAVRLRLARLVGGAVSECGADDDDRRPAAFPLGPLQGLPDRVEVRVAVLDPKHLPAVRLVPAADVFRESHRGRAV